MPVEEKSLPSSWHVLSPPVPRHMVLIPAPHTPPLSSADTGGPPTSMCACMAVPGRAHGYGQCFISLPPTSILSRWLVPLAPPPQQQLPPPAQPPPVPPVPAPSCCCRCDSRVKLSWRRISSWAAPPLLTHGKRSERREFVCKGTRYLPRDRSIQRLVPQALNWFLQLQETIVSSLCGTDHHIPVYFLKTFVSTASEFHLCVWLANGDCLALTKENTHQLWGKRAVSV